MTTVGAPPALDTRCEAGAGAPGREQDHVVATPTPAAPGRRVTQHGRWSAGDRDFLQFAAREEPDEPAVGRPEGEGPAFGPRNRPCGQRRRQVAARSGNAGWAPATNTMFRPSGDTATCVAMPVPPAEGPPNDMFSGGAIVNCVEPAAGRDVAGAAQRDDRRDDRVRWLTQRRPATRHGSIGTAPSPTVRRRHRSLRMPPM